MRLAKVLATLLLIVSTAACSYHWREADPGVDSATLFEMLAEVEQTAASSSNISVFTQLRDDEYTAIYFSEGPGPMGPVDSVMSLVDLSFLGPEFNNVTIHDLSYVRVFFLDGFDQNGERKNALAITVRNSDGSINTSKIFVNTRPPEFNGNEFLVVMGMGANDERLVLSSFDALEGEDFAGVIQLDVGIFTPEGNEVPIGKFSALAGFGI